MSEARRYFVRGKVQGVGFRWFVLREARDRGLSGYVRNLRDGRVEVQAEGPGAILDELRELLERGPGAARVQSVTEQPAGDLGDRYAGDFVVEY